MRVAQRRVLRRQDADVVADRDGLRLDREPGHRPMPALGEHVVEQHGVDASEHQIAVRMHVVFVRHGVQAVLALGAQQDLVGDRAAERRRRVLPRRSASVRKRAASASRTLSTSRNS